MKIDTTKLLKKRLLFSGVMLVMLILIGTLIAWAWISSQNARQLGDQLKTAIARQLSAQAQSIYSSGDSRQIIAVLLAAQSARMLPVTTDAARILQNNTLARPVFRMVHDGAVTSTAFSPDGKYVVTGGADKTVRVWDVTTGSEVARMIHDGTVTSVAFSLDGKHVASGSLDKTARVWEAHTGKETARMTHNELVTTVAFSPTGKYVVSGCASRYPLMNIYPRFFSAKEPVAGDARVWESATGQEVARMTRRGGILSAAFSPNGRYVASGSINGSAQVWVAATGVEVAFMSHGESVNSVAFSRDGKYVVSGSGDLSKPHYYHIEGNTARVWEASTGREVAHVTQNQPVIAVAFSPDNKYAASGSVDGVALVWDAATGTEVAQIKHDEAVLSLAFSSDSEYIASGSIDGTARVWQAATGKEIARMTHDSAVNSVVFRSDGKYVVSGSEDQTARVWEAVANTDVARVTQAPDDGNIDVLLFSPDGKYILSGGFVYSNKINNTLQGNTIQVWETATGKEIIRKSGTMTCAAFSPDGKYFATCGWNQFANIWMVNVWDTVTGQEVSGFLHDNVKFVAFTPDGRYVVSGGDYSVQAWEASTGKIVQMKVWEGMIAWWNTWSLSSDGKYVTAESSVNDNPIVYVWEVATGRLVAGMNYHRNISSALVFSPDGKYIVAGAFSISPDGGWVPIVQVWETATGKEVAHMINKAEVYAVAFSPDGKYIVSGGKISFSGIYSLLKPNEAIAQVWEVGTWKEVVHIAHDEAVVSVAFSPDSKYVISGSIDGTARVWEAATGKEIAHATYDGSSVSRVGFSVDGRYAISSGCVQVDYILYRCTRRTARVWLYLPEDLVAQACSRLTRNLTRMEWHEYIGDALSYQAVCPNLPLEPEPTPIP